MIMHATLYKYFEPEVYDIPFMYYYKTNSSLRKLHRFPCVKDKEN